MMNRKPKATFSEADTVPQSGRPGRRWQTLAIAGALAAGPMVTGIPQLSSPPQAHPVKSQTRQVGFVKSSVVSMRAARNATKTALSTPQSPDPVTAARSGAVTPVQDVAGAVTVVGVTWPQGAVTAKDEFQIRTLSGTTWSQWQTLDADEADGPDAKEAATAVRGTSPYVVTGASKYEVRTLTTDPTAPTAASVQAVDPGTSGADSVRPPPGAAAAATAKPAIYTRAAWGANERLRRSAPSYGSISLGFVHHTVSANSYSAASVPAMIRGIYAYHVQSLGWSDIGYNFLVDRFGRTWEGRYGGVDRPVVGAQTMNYNAVSFGVSAIGNFDVAGVPQAMTNAFKRIIAWKLSLTNLPATGPVPSPRPPSWSSATYFNRISGHRDGFQTTCPGRYLYARLPEIRRGAAALIAAAPKTVLVPSVVRSVIRRDVDRNGTTDALSYVPGRTGSPISGSTAVLVSVPRTPVRPAAPRHDRQGPVGMARQSLAARPASLHCTRHYGFIGVVRDGRQPISV